MNRDTARPDKLAKQMFFLGLLGLPWLWVVNILYFFNRVFGSRIFCCGNSSGNEDDEDRGILGLMSENDEDDDGRCLLVTMLTPRFLFWHRANEICI